MIFNFKQFHNNVYSAQLVECKTGDLEVPGSKSGSGEIFLLGSFHWGNEPNGEEQEQQQQLK